VRSCSFYAHLVLGGVVAELARATTIESYFAAGDTTWRERGVLWEAAGTIRRGCTIRSVTPLDPQLKIVVFAAILSAEERLHFTNWCWRATPQPQGFFHVLQPSLLNSKSPLLIVTCTRDPLVKLLAMMSPLRLSLSQ